jgi:hypothetical protein
MIAPVRGLAGALVSRPHLYMCVHAYAAAAAAAAAGDRNDDADDDMSCTRGSH